MVADDPRSIVVTHAGKHIRVSGPPASGKTKLLIERYRRLCGRGDRPVIIAYSRAERGRLIEAILSAGSGGLGEIPVFTYGQIASRALPVEKRLLRDVDELLVVDRLLRGSQAVNLTSDLATIVHSETLRRDVLTVIHPLLQHGVAAADARKAGRNARNARARDLLELHAAFVDTIESMGLVTYYNAARAACDALVPLAESGFTHVLIDDFQDIDAGQFRMIEVLAPPDGTVSVEVFGDPTGARFGFRGTNERFFVHDFPQRYRPDTVALPPPHTGHPVIGGAVSRLLEATGAGILTREPDPAGDLPLFRSTEGSNLVVDVMLAEDEIAEAQGIATRAVALIGEGVAPAQIAVLARERDNYEAILDEAFRGMGVPFDSGRRGRYVIEEFVQALLTVFAADGGPRVEHAKQSVIDSPFYVQFRETFAARASLRSRRIERDGQDLDRIVSLIRGGYVDKKTTHFSMNRFVDECIRPFVVGSGSQAPLSATALVDEWARYVELVGHIGGKPQLDEFRYLQRNSQSGSRIERDPEAVAFHSVREAAALTFDFVFVAGCSEGVFPAVDARSSYVPYAAIAECLQQSVVFHRGELRDEHALMLTALTRARSHLVISSPARFAGEEVTAPSHALAGIEGVTTVSRNPTAARRAAETIVTTSAFPATTPPVSFAAGAWMGAPPVAREFKVDPFPLSASSLDTYCNCERKFFYNKVLRIPQDKSMYLTIGSLFHEVMETLCRDNGSRNQLIDALDDKNIESIVAAAVGNSRDLAMAGALITAMTRYHIGEMLRRVRGIEKARPGEVAIGAPEEKIEFVHGAATIVGRVDRVDLVAGAATVLIDYKASANVYKRGRTIKEYLLGAKGAREKRHWQVPIYSFSVFDRTGEFPAAFCYYAVPVDSDAYIAGLFIGDGRTHDAASVMGAGKAQFDMVAEAELAGVMDEVSVLASEMFASTVCYQKTDIVATCKNCEFNRVCERYE